MTIPHAFDLALKNHQAGRLAEAEALYRQILAVQPNHADALHLLGLIAHRAGRYDIAVDLIRRAIVFDPNNFFAHSNLGEAHRAIGRLDDAVAAYRGALQVKWEFPEAHSNLGNALRDRGQLDEAIASYRRALELKPGYAEAHHNLGNALRDRGQLDESVAEFRRALELKPDYPEAHNNLGNALRDQGKLDEAKAALRRAIELKPGYPEAHNNLGDALREQGQFDESVAACRRALELRPGYPEAHNNLGTALAGQGRREEAIAAFRRALQLKPHFVEAHYNLGIALREQGQLDEAVSAFRRALELKPGYAEAHNNLGIALGEKGQLEEAAAAFCRALELKPDLPEAHNNLGNALKDQGDLDEAIATFRRALQWRPEDARTHSNLIYTLHFHPGHNVGTISEECHRWNRQFSEPQKRFIVPHANHCGPDRPLRIGYVSPDFREHVVGRNLAPLFQCHDRRDFEILCYVEVMRPDKMTEEFRRHANEWRSTVGMSDEALAEMIRGDRVDILVDLAQHLAGNRLPVFARKPAPVQASFAGYPESTGLEAINYRISDRYLEAGSAEDGPGRKEQVCLIDSFWCYDPCGMEVEIHPLPALENGSVTFGCLNNFCKVNESVIRLWARVLGKVTGSRLVMSSLAGSHRQRTLEAFERQGIEGGRLEFVGYHPRREYLELYHRLDIVLDTFPYNGHTTSLDALWMGVPVISLAGRTPVSRAGLSQLTNLGRPELVAHTEEDYVRIAAELAGDFPRLAQLRSTLRDRMKASVLMDAPRFTRQIEQAYREMWRAWRAASA